MIQMMMCKQATRLMSKRLDAPLSLRERFSLRFHLGMCGACRHCDRQFELLHLAGQRYRDRLAPDDDAR
ncbi:zf-HC2 domain-containing protein [Halomonas sp. YLGW01]|uniref:zf-HC2 domain-containing protein n=1 Tax=Halomonas sp. YLGW01 TaxID=2773308 RepID=UPI001F5BBB46|nr:zf-HC2 domain-containing protein [Halomonas sp. YLGW01]